MRSPGPGGQGRVAGCCALSPLKTLRPGPGLAVGTLSLSAGLRPLAGGEGCGVAVRHVLLGFELRWGGVGGALIHHSPGRFPPSRASLPTQPAVGGGSCCSLVGR